MGNEFERLRELERDQERAFYELGPAWASPPKLCEAIHEPGVSTRQAVDFLLDRIEHGTADGQRLRSILAACFGEMEVPLSLTQLWQLNEDSKPSVHVVLAWVGNAGGLRCHDFSDGGARFLRLVLRKSPQTIAKLVAEEIV